MDDESIGKMSDSGKNELEDRSKFQFQIAQDFQKIYKFLSENPSSLDSILLELFVKMHIDERDRESILELETTAEKADKLIEIVSLSKAATMEYFMTCYNLYSHDGYTTDDSKPSLVIEEKPKNKSEVVVKKETKSNNTSEIYYAQVTKSNSDTPNYSSVNNNKKNFETTNDDYKNKTNYSYSNVKPNNDTNPKKLGLWDRIKSSFQCCKCWNKSERPK